MSIGLILAICAVSMTVTILIVGFLAARGNAKPAYHPGRHPDGVDHGASASQPSMSRKGGDG